MEEPIVEAWMAQSVGACRIGQQREKNIYLGFKGIPVLNDLLIRAAVWFPRVAELC